METWQISKELYEHLQQHARNLVRGMAALEQRGGDSSKVQDLEEELSFLLIQLENHKHIKE